MLALDRKPGQKLLVRFTAADGATVDAWVSVVRVKGRRVTLAVDAPLCVEVWRDEMLREEVRGG